MTEPREIEAKFEFDEADGDHLRALRTVGRFTVRETRSGRQEDTYFDTADARLAQAGSTLRIRRFAGRARMTFKGQREAATSADDAHIASRLEDEVTLTREQVSSLSIEEPLPALTGLTPLDRARSIAGDDVLVPVARLLNTRTTLLLESEAGESLELAIDDCTGTRLRDGRIVTFDELEVETIAASRDALIEVTRALRQQIPSLRPSQKTKLERTLA